MNPVPCLSIILRTRGGWSSTFVAGDQLPSVVAMCPEEA